MVENKLDLGCGIVGHIHCFLFDTLGTGPVTISVGATKEFTLYIELSLGAPVTLAGYAHACADKCMNEPENNFYLGKRAICNIVFIYGEFKTAIPCRTFQSQILISITNFPKRIIRDRQRMNTKAGVELLKPLFSTW